MARNIKMYQYRAVASYAEQVARYLDAFGRENVHVIIFDDFIRDPAASYRMTLDFLGIDATFQPELAVVNAHAANISPRLASLVRDPAVVRRLKRLVPRPLHHPIGRLRAGLRGWNRKSARRAPVDLELRGRLRAELAPDVARLGELLGRDLSAIW